MTWKSATPVKPVHSLVAAVMEGVGTPYLIVDGAGSPHTYALKPSQAGNLQNADLVFWIGDRLETFLEKRIESIAKKAKLVTLIESHGLNQLKFREGGAFDSHDHEHDDHGHDDHGHNGYDPHVWLDQSTRRRLSMKSRRRYQMRIRPMPEPTKQTQRR